MKKLSEISWNVTEEEYRKDSSLSYSILTRYERGGFNELKHLFDKIETPSLTFGSGVDSIITGGMKEFNDKFVVADYNKLSDSIIEIVKDLFNNFNSEYDDLLKIPANIIAEYGKNHNFYANDKYENYRIKLIREGKEYYDLLFLSKDKMLIDSSTYDSIIKTASCLKDSDTTRFYFQENNPFDNIERYYQLKFKSTFEGINYRCMADELIVLHDEKLVIPIDLKTSHHSEWDFYKSFKDWSYSTQARLYWRIIRDNMDKDSYFKDFKLDNYKFIVINKDSLKPLIWECSDTTKSGLLIYGKNKQITFRDPFEIGAELNYYLNNDVELPINVNKGNPNNIEQWLNTL